MVKTHFISPRYKNNINLTRTCKFIKLSTIDLVKKINRVYNLVQAVSNVVDCNIAHCC